jgi:glycosyltransferase involved in cell wall biosynthesis
VGVSEAVLAGLPRSATAAVIPPAIPAVAADRERGAAALVSATGGNAGSEFVVLVGRLDPHKGHEDALAAMPELLRRRPQARLVLVGGEEPGYPGYETHLRRRSHELGIDEAVALLGHRDDAVELMGGARVVVVPSRAGHAGRGAEGFGLVGIEAQAVGTPVVGYAAGALPEVLGPCARLVPSGDVAALGDAITHLLEDESTWERAAACGRERSAGRYTVAAMIEGMRRQYDEAAASSYGR